MSFSIVSSDNSTGPLGFGSSEGYASGDGVNFPIITNSVGDTVPSGSTVTLAGFKVGICCMIQNGGNNTFNLLVKGTAVQTQFGTISYTDFGSTVFTFNATSATFDTSSYPGYSWWHWSNSDIPGFIEGFPFNNGGTYLMTVTGEVFPSLSIVPNIVGLPIAAANAAIIAAGLTVGTVTTANNTSFVPGTVSAQSPAGNSSVSTGSAVTYTECLGPVRLGATFVPASVFKAIMVANPGYINPRVYPPTPDNTVRVPNQRIMT